MSSKFFNFTLKKQIIAVILILCMMFVFVPQKSDAIILTVIALAGLIIPAAAAIAIALVETAIVLCIIGVICGGDGGGPGGTPVGTGTVCLVENSCGMSVPGTIASNGHCSVTPAPDSYCTPVISNFTFSPSTVWPNQTYTLTWDSLYADTCTASNAWTGTKPTSGNEAVTAPITSGTIRHTLTCHSGGSGGSSIRHIDITINEPSLNLSLSQSLLRKGDSSVVSWSITPDPRTEPSTTCTLSGVAGSPYDVTSGPTDTVDSGPINNTRRVTLDCSIYDITYTEKIFINVIPTIFES